MPQYPNDPGMDMQVPQQYVPHTEADLVDVNAFAAAMETQTRYSYECAVQMKDLCMKALDEASGQQREVLQQLLMKLDGYIKHNDETVEILRKMIKRIAVDEKKLEHRVSDIQYMQNVRMNTEDYQLLLGKIFSIV